MADEYIKRKDVLECIKESRDGIDWGQSEDGDAFLHYSACLYRTIASNECLPSADVAEVRHGEWEVVGINTYELSYGGTAYEPFYRCSKCKMITESYLRLDEPIMPEDASFPNFCPNCGADMRKDGE